MTIAQIEKTARSWVSLSGLTGAVVVVLLGTWLRFHRIESQSLWYDEGNTAHMTGRAGREIVRAAAADIHPPGYYLAVTGWSRLVGGTEFALRSFSAFAGVVLLGILYRLGKETWGAAGGLLAAFLGAIHPALIYYSQEARMYMLASVLGAVLVMLSGRLTGYGGVRWQRKSSYLFIAVAAAGLYTHYSFAFVYIAINLGLVWPVMRTSKLHRPLPNGEWLVVQLAVLILYAPWMATAIRHLTTWPAERSQIPIMKAGAELAHWLAVGPTIELTNAVPGATAIGLLVLIGARTAGRGLLPLWLGVPAVLTLSFGLFGESFAKFLVLGVPAVVILAGGGAASLICKTGTSSRILGVVLLAPAVWITGKAILNLYIDPVYYRDDYRTIAAELTNNHRTGDAILLNAPNQMEVFSYYYSEPAHVFPVARGYPLVDEDQRAELAAIAADHDRLTVLYWGDEQADPAMVVERWLNEHTYKTWSQWYGKVRVARYSVPDVSFAKFVTVNTYFGSSIQLRGYSIGRESYSPGDVIQVMLLWKPEEEIEENYNVFVHLYSEINAPPVAQHDGAPAGGNVPTAAWNVGEEVVDRHGVQLPRAIGPGEYTLAAGLYSVDGGKRVPVTEGIAKDNRLVLGTISVID